MHTLVLTQVNLCTKSKVCSFACSRDVMWAQKFTNGSRDLNDAHVWVVCHLKANTQHDILFQRCEGRPKT